MSQPSYNVVMQVFRMLRLLQQRGTRGMPVNELARELECNRRTVVRYLQALHDEVDDDEGAPIVRRELRDGAAWAVMSTPRSPVSASIFQYAAVFAATRHLTGRSLLRRSAGDVLDKIEDASTLSQDLLERVQTGFCYVPWGPKDYGGDSEVLDEVVQSIAYRRPLDIGYRRPGADDVSQRRIDPWTLVMYRDGLYVLGPVSGTDGARPQLYAVDRIEDADTVRKGSFEIPDDFDPDRFFGRGLGLWQTADPAEVVRLAFTPKAALYARERRWPGLVQWSTEGGREVLTLKVAITPEVVSWASAWGADMEVLSPPALRDRVATHLREALQRYD